MSSVLCFNLFVAENDDTIVSFTTHENSIIWLTYLIYTYIYIYIYIYIYDKLSIINFSGILLDFKLSGDV